ncbi:lantibiotic dehydratase C-terminal domain-containing protein [Devriesea agamarum]|uniref:lantibiotic dehydratase C-terminal domain-containing protein n=1 Tax=Devriesea agamarum TaxID=472569 RepID=UPI00071CCE02|nr:lantibiotic dehydratase C-terminal domain-containing protein [Devriesea agamarum]
MNSSVFIPKALGEEAELRKSHVWRSYHVFYGGNPLILLRDCIIPLVEALQSESVIRDYFFINYWLEGSHVRLRLRVKPEMLDDLDKRVLGEVRDYLAISPSYHPMAELMNNSFYENLFKGEYPETDRWKYFDSDGAPIFANNNSIEIREYEPEWLRYGGEVGILISERQFVESTQLVVQLMHLGNLGVRTILLGIASQITYITAVCLLDDLDLVEKFLLAYHRRWSEGYETHASYLTEAGLNEHRVTVENLRKKIVPLADAIRRGETTGFPKILGEWVRLCQKTRHQIKEACKYSTLVFEYNDGVRVATKVEEAAWSLCHSFIHMTNNRMMVSVTDEGFLAYQLVEAMRGKFD